MAMPVEVEHRYRVVDPAALDRLVTAERLGAARLAPVRMIDEVDRYLDTADGHLAAAGWACRLRTRGDRTIVSLKGPPESRAGALHRRPELEGPAAAAGAEVDPAGWPPSEARRRVLELAGGRALRERLVLRQRRAQRAVLDADGRIGTLTLDRVAVVGTAGSVVGRLLVVELEELDGGGAVAPGALASAVEALESDPALVPEPDTKLERALAMAVGTG